MAQTNNYYVIKGDVVCINDSKVRLELSRNVPVCITKMNSSKEGRGLQSKFRIATHAKFSKHQ